YGTLASIYAVVRKAYTKRVYVDKEFQKKTNQLVQDQIGTYDVEQINDFVEINADTIELIKAKKGGDGTKIINLVKSIEKIAEENKDDPNLIAMAERAQAVLESFENRQKATADALADLFREIENNEKCKKEQAEKGFDGLTFFVYQTLLDADIDNAEDVSRKIKDAFAEFPNWRKSENALRELRKMITFAIFSESDDLDKVTTLVDELFVLLEKAERI
ncbi:MAG: type I restriction endonuclease subunit R, partial [Proteobacteria bacterium]|nr:type I restriction endonuclease subunit R [Pseudomonadota bacterium]